MKQAKWLLLIAVGILLVLPGCNSMNPTVSPEKPDVRIASYTQQIGTAPIMSGGGKTQFQIGDVYFYWQYDYFDPSLPPGPNGNGQFVNLMFGVRYETYSPTYPITDAHLNISITQPTGRGAPGLYNFNSYLQPNPPNAYTAIFLIPEAALMAVPWHCGDWLWFLCHVSAGDVTGMAGTQHRNGGSWWNDLRLHCTNPTPPGNPEPPDYREETAWAYNIADPTHWFWALGPSYKWGGVMPYTLGTANATFDLWAGAGQNDPSKGTKVGTVTITDTIFGGIGNVYVHYVLTGSCLASEAHAGAAIDLQTLSNNSNKFAPGQLGVNGSYDPWDDDFTLVIPYNPAWTTSFVVAAHAVVYIPEPEATYRQTTGE